MYYPIQYKGKERYAYFTVTKIPLLICIPFIDVDSYFSQAVKSQCYLFG